MNNDRWQLIEQIFNQAVLLTPPERNLFIQQKCRDDYDLYTETISLFDAHDGAAEFLEESVFPVVAKLLEYDVTEFLIDSHFASYKLHKSIGRGGMGTVFLAEDRRLERLVAIKILPSKIAENPETVLRFQQEAKAASAISHQNVAYIYEFDNYQGTYFLVMEYVEGKTLREIIKNEPIDLLQTIDIISQIAEAICAAHLNHVIHRDIKPENILVTEKGLVKVLDFGIAKLGEKHRQKTTVSLETSPGVILGTTAYMSPEQIRSGQVTEQTDIWSLGVILYELIGGKRPFDGKTRSDVRAKVLLAQTEPLPIFDEIPQFKKIIAKTLAKNPEERFAAADDLVYELNIARREAYDYLANMVSPKKRPNKFLRFFKNFSFSITIILVVLCN